MSRTAARDLAGAMLLAGIYAIWPMAPLHAQEARTSAASPVITAEDALEASRTIYGPPKPKDCGPAADGEIVVCGRPVDNEQFRVESDTDSGQAIGDGVPRPPDVAGEYIFRGPATVGGLCGFGLKGCPPPPIYIVDFEALPDAPPGSDADRISRGLPPRGNDGGRAAPATGAAAEPAAD
ncbi:hypothetical protein [Pseudopontixanthobacter vadosimaris]|uniref:hypothetical protein n=1 Tax=Pseudopontixanthobacter vadosimaris TaxID=2726450 RepID=UPI001474AE27|nr:hypothetical protein [Pseudopontixanthobacter vadosimaris]